MKKSYMLLLVGGALVVGIFFWRRNSEGATDSVVDGPEIATVQREDIRREAEPNGRVISNLDIEIKCKASGQIVSLPLDVSDHVKKGDLLMEIDPIDQQRSLTQMQASLDASRARKAQAEASLSAAEKNLSAERARSQAALAAAEARLNDMEAKARRDQKLLEQKHVSIEEAETSRTAAAEAKANLDTARAALEGVLAQADQLNVTRQDIRLADVQISSDEAAVSLGEQRLTETKVLSPIDGVIAKRSVQIGQIIASGINNIGGGTTVMIVSDLSRIFVLASVDESDIGEVKVGQSATITVDAFPKDKFAGEVVRIASQGTNLTNVVTFEVKIEVTSPNKDMLKPEMTANVKILIAESKDALTVPIRAITRKSGETYVQKHLGEMKTEEVPVTLGISDGYRVAIEGAVKEGDEVLMVRTDEESRWYNQNAPKPQPLFGGSKKKK